VTESTSSNNSQTTTDSAPTVKPEFLFGPASVGEPTNIKCTTCKVPTLHHWFMQHVDNVGGTVHPGDVMALHKRVTICTACGTMRLIA
jgi:hypothetical protein